MTFTMKVTLFASAAGLLRRQAFDPTGSSCYAEGNAGKSLETVLAVEGVFGCEIARRAKWSRVRARIPSFLPVAVLMAASSWLCRYRGLVDTTTSGVACLRWTEVTPEPKPELAAQGGPSVAGQVRKAALAPP